jgi:hypothetical protein
MMTPRHTGDEVSALGKIAVNTTICASSSAIVSTAITLWKEKAFEPYSAVNGLLAGNAASPTRDVTITTRYVTMTTRDVAPPSPNPAHTPNPVPSSPRQQCATLLPPPPGLAGSLAAVLSAPPSPPQV